MSSRTAASRREKLRRAEAARARLAENRQRLGGRRHRRRARTLILGALAAAAAIYWLAWEYGVDGEELAGFLWASLAALAGAALLRGGKKLLARAGRSKPPRGP